MVRLNLITNIDCYKTAKFNYYLMVNNTHYCCKNFMFLIFNHSSFDFNYDPSNFLFDNLIIFM